MKVRKAKKEIKVLKEIDSRNFKEVKKEKNANVSDSEEESSDLEQDFSFSDNGSSSRTAPVLKSENSSQLEATAATAPVSRPVNNTGNDNNAPAGNFYTANYDAKYDRREYAGVEREQIVQPSVRASGSLIEHDFDMRALRRMPASQAGGQNFSGQENWTGGVPEERRYQQKDDALKEETKQIDKRRRMF